MIDRISTGLFAAMLLLSPAVSMAAVSMAAETKPAAGQPAEAPAPKLETHKNLIEKARNLTLQRDRLQASQVLIRALKKEIKTSAPYKEMAKALEELTGIFYTEKGQTLYSLAESVVENKPREAIEAYQAALRAEDGNVSALKALARAYLTLNECDSALTVIAQAETFNPVSPEVRLLRIQVSECAGQSEKVGALLAAADVDLAPVEKYARPLQIRDLLRKKEIKKARQVLAAWEAAQPEYPEVHFWK